MSARAPTRSSHFRGRARAERLDSRGGNLFKRRQFNAAEFLRTLCMETSFIDSGLNCNVMC